MVLKKTLIFIPVDNLVQVKYKAHGKRRKAQGIAHSAKRKIMA
jgi:hypothetical protein